MCSCYCTNLWDDPLQGDRRVGGLLIQAAVEAQLGEFSFVIAAVGLQSGIISGFAHRGTIVLIALTLLLSPAWIAAMGKLAPQHGQEA